MDLSDRAVSEVRHHYGPSCRAYIAKIGVQKYQRDSGNRAKGDMKQLIRFLRRLGLLHRSSTGAQNLWTLRASIAAVVVLLVMSGCASSPASRSSDVVLVGDSLAEQAAPYLGPLLHGRQLVPQFFGGTAPCDWLAKNLEFTADSVVVISFTGNSLSPCMSDSAGGPLAGPAVVDKYRADVTALIDEVLSAQARVLLVGQPVHADATPGNDIVAGLNGVYADLATRADVSFVDAGAAVENPDGSFAQFLPCLPDEPECGPFGSNIVRNDDGLHFCPGAPPPGPCPVYSSGASRFANAIAAAIETM